LPPGKIYDIFVERKCEKTSQLGEKIRTSKKALLKDSQKESKLGFSDAN
jgi:hypothetical protein